MESITFEDIRPLFLKHIDDAPVKEFLQRFPDHRITKPNDGVQFAIFWSLGFDLRFQPPAGPQGGPSKKLRVLTTVFLYRAGEEKHQEFREPPFGVKFTDSHDLVQKLGEPSATSLEMNVTPLAWEKWRVGDLTIHFKYDRSTMTTPNLLGWTGVGALRETYSVPCLNPSCCFMRSDSRSNPQNITPIGVSHVEDSPECSPNKRGCPD